MKLKLYWIIPILDIQRFWAANSNHFEGSSFKQRRRCGANAIVMSILEVFSKHLDPKKHWFVLDSSLCGISPRKFCENEIFQLFTEEVSTIKVRELSNQNGDQIVPARLGLKTFKENVYVGTTFALTAGNLRRRNPHASHLLKSSGFQAIKDIINEQALEHLSNVDVQSSISTGPSTPITSSSSTASSSTSSSLESVDEDKEREVPEGRRRKKLAPKNLAPIFTSTPNNLRCKYDSTFEEIEKENNKTPYKKRKVREKAASLISEIHDICRANNEELSTVIARCCCFERREEVLESERIIQDVFREVEKKLGLEKTFEKLIPDDLWAKKLENMTVPDWQLLLLKLEVPISDDSWQTLLNRSNLGKGGRFGKCTPLLLSKNSIKAIKSLVFGKVEKLFGITPIDDITGIPGYQVGLEPVICWQVRELHLHGEDQQQVQLNLKLDGRPFAGRSQVLIGVIPSKTVNWSPHSCKSFYPLAIANCQENRENLCSLISKLNKEKDHIKKHGVKVDGKLYTVVFKVTLDLKALYTLLVKPDDPEFCLGGRGFDIEFCFFCQALRNCSCDLGPDAVCLTHLQEVKANIGGFKGIRDDLTFLLEEDITSINLCALHCELRNTEQLIGSLGLHAHRIGTLKHCNEVLSKYGPENAGDRIKLKMKEGQQTRVSKQNISVTSFSGNTERCILENIEEIVRESLPHEALRKENNSLQCAKATLLNKLSFCSQQVKYYQGQVSKGVFTRDFGKSQEDVPLQGLVLQKMLEYKTFWQNQGDEIKSKLSSLPQSKAKKVKKTAEKCDSLSGFAAEITFKFFLMVFTEWRDIAKVLRERVFGEEDQHLIDVFDLQCKHWGFLLREVFGVLLGTGDYGHMTIEHSSMLLRQFGSLKEYSNQSIESAHSMQRQLYSKASSHDRHGYTSSIRQMLEHFYSERMLFFRLCVRKALECHDEDKPFHFVGCGWSTSHARSICWSSEDIKWMVEMDTLLTKLFGPDFMNYTCDPQTKIVSVAAGCLPVLEYDHQKWENEFSLIQQLNTTSPSGKPTEIALGTSNSTRDYKKLVLQPMPKGAVSSAVQSCPVPPQRSFYPDLKQLCKSNLTRRQIASLILPPVAVLSQTDLSITAKPLFLSNPYFLPVRPSSTILQECITLLQKAGTGNAAVVSVDDSSNEIAIKIDGLGVFNRHVIDVWNAASEAQTIREQVKNEVKWLAQSKDVLSDEQCTEIEQVLLDSQPYNQVLAVSDIIVDVHDLSTLVDERYLTGFVIDIACLKIKEQAKNNMQVVYLPTSCQAWTLSGDHDFAMSKIRPYLDIPNLRRVHWILTPIHVNGNHWGLLCLDMKASKLYYDDSMHIPPPLNILQSVEVLLQALHGLSSQFSLSKWSPSFPIEDFGMPTQPPGSGSCGMGVILSVQSFFDSPSSVLPVFLWSFNGMQKHRRMLMNNLIECKTQ